MNLGNNTNMQVVALLVLAVSVKLFMDHRRIGYSGVYNPSGSYENITAVKHDMTKAFWVELFILMALGLGSGEVFYDANNVLGSWLGKSMVIVASYFTYYEMLQPYVIDRLPVW